MKKLIVFCIIVICMLLGSCDNTPVDLSGIKADIVALEAGQLAQEEINTMLWADLGTAEDRLDVLEASGGSGTPDAYHIPIKVYCDNINNPMNYDAIEYEKGTVTGVMLGMQFSIANGGRVNEPCEVIYLVPEISLAGAGPRFVGVAFLEGAHHGRTVLGLAEWKRVPGDGGPWAVRVEFANFNWINDTYRSGFKYYGKRPFLDQQWLAFTGDSIIVTIPMTLGWADTSYIEPEDVLSFADRERVGSYTTIKSDTDD